jgi:hypothetical protein
MASTTPHTIVLRSNNPDNAMQRVREAPCQAAVTITPGMLLEWGTTTTVKPHATAGGETQGKKVALENPWSDHGSGAAIAHAYAAAETVAFIPAQPGDQLYMLLADGQNVAKGAALTSDGAGALAAFTELTTVDDSGYTVYTESIVGYASEAVNNSAGGAVARIRVDIA